MDSQAIAARPRATRRQIASATTRMPASHRRQRSFFRHWKTTPIIRLPHRWISIRCFPHRTRTRTHASTQTVGEAPLTGSILRSRETWMSSPGIIVTCSSSLQPAPFSLASMSMVMGRVVLSAPARLLGTETVTRSVTGPNTYIFGNTGISMTFANEDVETVAVTVYRDQFSTDNPSDCVSLISSRIGVVAQPSRHPTLHQRQEVYVPKLAVV